MVYKYVPSIALFMSGGMYGSSGGNNNNNKKNMQFFFDIIINCSLRVSHFHVFDLMRDCY